MSLVAYVDSSCGACCYSSSCAAQPGYVGSDLYCGYYVYRNPQRVLSHRFSRVLHRRDRGRALRLPQALHRVAISFDVMRILLAHISSRPPIGDFLDPTIYFRFVKTIVQVSVSLGLLRYRAQVHRCAPTTAQKLDERASLLLESDRADAVREAHHGMVLRLGPPHLLESGSATRPVWRGRPSSAPNSRPRLVYTIIRPGHHIYSERRAEGCLRLALRGDLVGLRVCSWPLHTAWITNIYSSERETPRSDQMSSATAGLIP